MVRRAGRRKGNPIAVSVKVNVGDPTLLHLFVVNLMD